MTPTPTPTSLPTSLQGSSRECRRVAQLATGITSIARIGRVGEDPREEIGVGVGAVECELKPTEDRRGYIGEEVKRPESCEVADVFCGIRSQVDCRSMCTSLRRHHRELGLAGRDTPGCHVVMRS